MRSLIVGTAGHIDHGKSALVRALTGTDPDRLKEEKERGITIDLGFAHLDLGAPGVVSFIDVPGHERFVRNMLAGAHGIDAVLLVVAADESVMPQTREHFHICRLLGIPAGVVALTKCDVADAESQTVAEMEVRELLAGSFLEGAPVLRVSARTGPGPARAPRARWEAWPRARPRGRWAGLCGCRWTAPSRCAGSGRWSRARSSRARWRWATRSSCCPRAARRACAACRCTAPPSSASAPATGPP